MGVRAKEKEEAIMTQVRGLDLWQEKLVFRK